MIASIPLALVFALAAAFSLVEALRSFGREVPSYIADREAHATHVVMNGGMAAMVVPGFGGDRILAAVFLAGMAALAIDLLVRRRPAGGVGGTLYHLVGLAAMAWAAWRMAAMMPGMAMGRSWPAVALAVVFALDGIATAVLAGVAPRLLLRMADRVAIGDAAAPQRRRVAEVRVAALPHCLMDAGMVAMLVTL